jgi:Tol biopolymer transport system component
MRADHLRVLAALALAAVLAAGLLLLVALPKPAEAAFPGKNGKITFVRGTTIDSEDREIYVMDAQDQDADGNGDNLTRLTHNNMVDALPAFSPDGERIAFTSRRDSIAPQVNDEIYVMDAQDRDGDENGDDLTRITNSLVNEFQPAFSPDGQRIVFTSNQTGDNEIYVMNSDGTEQTRLTSNAARDARPAFSPDGERIAFTSNRDSDDEIYVMDAKDEVNNDTGAPGPDGNGDNLKPLTSNIVPDTHANFSPDGREVAFISRASVGNDEIYVVSSDGSGVSRRLTNNPATDEFPVFSPDGTKVAFASRRDSIAPQVNDEIYVMDAADSDGDGEGDNLTRITNNPASDSKPDWGPFVYGFTADLEVRFRYRPPSPRVGDRVKIVLTVTNNGPDAAQNVSIEGELTNRDRRIRDRNMIQKCSTGGTAEECLDELPPGETIKTTFSGKPLEPQRIKASYQASSDATDPDPDNNEDSVSFRVTRAR